MSTTRKRSGQQRAQLARRRSVVRIELEQEVQLVKRNIMTAKPWLDGLHVTAFVVVNAAISIAVATCVALAAALVLPPQRSSSVQLDGMHREPSVAWYAASFYVLIVVVGSIVVWLSWNYYEPTNGTGTKSKLDSLRKPTSSLVRLLRKLWVSLTVSVAVSIAASVAIQFLDYPATGFTRYLRLTVLFTVCYGYALCIATASPHKRAFSVSSRVTSLDSSVASVVEPSGVVLFKSQKATAILSATCAAKTAMETAPWPRWDTRRRIDMVLPFVAIHVSMLYLYVASAAVLDSQLSVLVFSCASVVIKVVLQEAAKHLQLRTKRPLHSLAIHAALTVPTIVIDAQIRLVCMRFGGGAGPSVAASSVWIVCGEMLFRTAKIVRLRHTISTRLAACKARRRILQRMQSKTVVRDLSAARAEYAKFLEWRERALQIHAAEVYADMHGEYIAIGCAIVVTYFVGATEPLNGTPHASRPAQRASLTAGICVAALFQVVLGLAGDYVLSIIESVHEVPLRETMSNDDPRLRPVLRVLLGALAGLHVAGVVVFYVA